MLRITIIDDASEQRWILQGRLVAPWIADLETTWKMRSPSEMRRVVVDLSDITQIDKRGEKMLRTMRTAGAELLACGVYVRHIVECINARCRDAMKAQRPSTGGNARAVRSTAPSAGRPRRIR